MGKELREENAKLSKGNRGKVFMCFCLFCGLVSSSAWEQRASKAIHALNFTVALAFEIKPIGGKEHNLEMIVTTSDTSYDNDIGQFSVRLPV